MIVIYFIIAAAVFALGCWQGYIIAAGKFTKEIKDLKNQPVKVKVIRQNTIPLSVTERVSTKDVARGGDYFLLELENRMHQNLLEDIKPYILKQSCRDQLTESYVFKETLLVVKPMEGEEL